MATASVRILRQLFWWQKIGCDLVSCNKSYATSSISWWHCVSLSCFIIMFLLYLYFFIIFYCVNQICIFISTVRSIDYLLKLQHDMAFNNVFINMKYFYRALTFLWMNAVSLIDILTPIKVYDNSASFNNNYYNVLMLLYRVLDEKNSSLRWKWNFC